MPIAGDELRATKRYFATREDNLPWLFVSERQAQLTRQAVNYIVRLAGEKAKLGRVSPHMLRHSCGYYLADQGTDLRTMQDYLGHRDPKHTAHYTRVAGYWDQPHDAHARAGRHRRCPLACVDAVIAASQ
jgi:type 1 fimbriae regulatory protein FimB